MLITLLLLLHGLIAVGLLGAITHQAVAVLRHGSKVGKRGFVASYTAVDSRLFVHSVIAMYIASTIVGGLIYPSYRLDVRTAFEEMELGWAVGLFELKEHWGGIGLGVLPLYAMHWHREARPGADAGRIGVTLTLAFVVWFDFIVGHLLNNLRGL